MTCICLMPVVFCNLRARLDGRVTASDASETGGAFSMSLGLTERGRLHANTCARHAEHPSSEQLALFSCYDGIGGARRAIELLGLSPAAYWTLETDTTARRITRCQWPSAVELGPAHSVRVVIGT